MSKPFIAFVGLTLTGTVAWLKLNEEQKEHVKEVIKINRRKLANLIAPSEDLGDLTNAVDPAVLEEIAAFCRSAPESEEG
jgi:hypothetical protein